MFKKGFLLDTSDGIGDERSNDRSLWWSGGGGVAAASSSTSSSCGWGGHGGDQSSSWKNSGAGWGRSANKTSTGGSGWGSSSGWGSPPPSSSTGDDGKTTKASAEAEAEERRKKEKEEEEERRARYAAMPTYTKATGVPKTDITIWYSRRYGDLLDGRHISSEDYETSSEDCDIRIRARGNSVITYKLKYTSVFICPVSGDRYPSGRWGDPIGKEGGDSGGELGGESIIWWFTKKKDAEHAAARRALDCLSLMEDHIGTLQGPPLRICGEEPKLPTNMEPFLRHHERRQQKQRRDEEDHKEDDGTEDDDDHSEDEDDAAAAVAGGEEGMDVSDDAKKGSTPPRRQRPRQRRKPQPRDEHDRAIPPRPDRLTQQKSALMDWYRRRHLDDVYNTNALASAFEARCDGGPAHEKLWTAEFTCPVSGRMYPSGRFGRGGADGPEGEVEADRGNAVDRRYTLEEGGNGNTVWYRNKKEAEHAAAARALDAFDAMDEELGRTTVARRLCEEPPIPVGDDSALYRAEPGLDEEASRETTRSRRSYRKARRTGPTAVAMEAEGEEESSEPRALEEEGGPLRGDFVPLPMETS